MSVELSATPTMEKGRQGDSDGERHGQKIGICGPAPSDHSECARLPVAHGIDSLLLNPVVVLDRERACANQT